MHPLPYTWPVGALFWLALCWAFAGELPFMRRDRVADAAPTDKGSMRLVLITAGMSVFFAFLAAGVLRGLAIPSLRMPIYVAGVASIAAGGALRRHCFHVLGGSFTYDVRVASTQRVVEHGAYRYVRHPSYTAGLLIFAGIGLALGNWISLAVAIVFPLLAYAYRIAVEERALVAALGPAYADYMARTRRLIPFVL